MTSLIPVVEDGGFITVLVQASIKGDRPIKNTLRNRVQKLFKKTYGLKKVGKVLWHGVLPSGCLEQLSNDLERIAQENKTSAKLASVDLWDLSPKRYRLPELASLSSANDNPSQLKLDLAG